MGRLFSALAAIRGEIDAKRVGREEHLRQRWQGISSQLPRFIDNQEQLSQVTSTVESGLEGKSLRSVQEQIDHLEQVSAGVKTLSLGMFSSAPEREPLAEFNSLVPHLEQLLDDEKSLMVIAQKIRSGEELPDFVIPAERREMTAQALEAWRALKRSGATARQENLPLVTTIVKYLGFRL